MVLLSLLIIAQVLPDFQVNSEDYPGKGFQLYPAIAFYDTGGIAVWLDFRLPYSGPMIFGSRLNSAGSPIGTNYILNDDSTHGCQLSPDVACDFEGNFTAAWTQFTGGSHDITARRFFKDGTPAGPSFVVNEVPTSCYYPKIAVDSSWQTVITWSDQREGANRVYGQIYDDQGNSIGSNFKVSDSLQGSQIFCDVSIGKDKGFYVTWGINDSIWCQRFDSLGNRIGGNFKISDTTGGDRPAIRCNHDGYFLITWSKGSPTYQSDVYFRLYDSSATPVTGVVKVNDPQLTHSWLPRTADFKDSLWFVCWEDSFADIFLQRISKTGGLIGNNIQINEPIGEQNRTPDIAATKDYFFITWFRRTTHYVWDIMIQVVDPDGNPVGQNKVISDDRGGAIQAWPAAIADTSGNFFIVWDDGRDPEFNLLNRYGKRFDAQGNPLSEDIRINENIDAQASAIGLNDLGLYVVTWTRTETDSDHQIYGQRFDRNGTPLGGNFQISLGPGNTRPYYPRIQSLSNNEFVVVWNEARVPHEFVYGRFLDPLGIPYGDEFRTVITPAANNLPWSIIDEGNNRFLIGMSCDDDSIGVAIQEFDYHGMPTTDPIILNEHPSGYVPNSGAKGMDRYLFTWPTRTVIYGQFLNDSLQKIGVNFLVSEDTTAFKDFPSVVSNDKGRFFVIWEDERNGDGDIYGQFFDAQGNKIGNNFKVDNDTTNSEQWFPSCYAANDLIYIAWSDWRIPEHFYDIYAKVIEWVEPGVTEDLSPNLFNKITLAPNPFRRSLRIVIPGGKGKVRIDIFDITGRRVQNFFLRHSQILNWNGRDKDGRSLPAGIYFVKIKSESQGTIKKVVKIR